MILCQICRQRKREYYSIRNNTYFYCPDCYKFEKESTERRIRQLHEKRRFSLEPDFSDHNAVKRARRERQLIDYYIREKTNFLTTLNSAVHLSGNSLLSLEDKKRAENSMKTRLEFLNSEVDIIRKTLPAHRKKELEEQAERIKAEEEQRRKQEEQRRKQEEQRRKQEEQRRKMQEESRKRAAEKHREQMGCIKGIILFFAIASILWISFAYLLD